MNADIRMTDSDPINVANYSSHNVMIANELKLIKPTINIVASLKETAFKRNLLKSIRRPMSEIPPPSNFRHMPASSTLLQ